MIPKKKAKKIGTKIDAKTLRARILQPTEEQRAMIELVEQRKVECFDVGGELHFAIADQTRKQEGS